jgi:thioesterase domain-containing protein
LPLRTLFELPTVAELAGRIQSALNEATQVHANTASSVVQIQGGGSNPPLFVPHDLSGDVGFAKQLAECLGEGQTVYAFHNVSGKTASERGGTMEELAAGYVEDLLAFQPDGPYCLAGYSFSGYLAYEMARHLQLRGKGICHLGIIDASAPLPKKIPLRTVLAGSINFLKNIPLWVWDDVLKCPPDEMIRRIRRKIYQVEKGLKKSIRFGLRAGLDKDLEDIFDLEDLSKDIVERMDHHLKILNQYNPGPYSGSLTLYLARAQPLFRLATSDLGWKGLVAGEIEIVKIAACHDSIVKEQNLLLVAKAMRAAMDRIR